MPRSSNRALFLALGLCVLASAACNEAETYIEVGVDFTGNGTPPDVFQLKVYVEEQGSGRNDTLMFPETKSPTKLGFPATAVVIVPSGSEKPFDITVTALDSSGQQAANTEEGTVTGVIPVAGAGRDAAVRINVRAPVVGLYKACTDNSMCDQAAGQQCAAVGVKDSAPNQFCSIQGCDDSGDGSDVRCNSADGIAGKCFSPVGTSLRICLPTCESHDDCGPGQACSTNAGGFCFSACTGDADCQDGTVCQPVTADTPEERRLCVTA